jgi:large subunit ribosomal protein L21
MFAIVRTGGKQYRVAAGDKIVVEKLAGAAGDTLELGDVLLAGEGADLKSTDGLTVSAEIIAQAKGDKVTVFKKRRRHNYRRKAGHRQQHTILRITAIGGEGAKANGGSAAAQSASEASGEAEAKPTKKAAAKKTAPAGDEGAKPKKAKAEAPLKQEGAESEMTDTPTADKQA